MISLHWGEGMVEYPRPDQVEFARSLSEIGVDIIFGHHPHCIQGVEVFRNTAIIYSAEILLRPATTELLIKC